jgi:hypothetical protein
VSPHDDEWKGQLGGLPVLPLQLDDGFDAGARRPDLEGSTEALDALLVTGRDDFDTAVRAVGYPSGELTAARLFADEPPKPDPLNLADDAHVKTGHSLKRSSVSLAARPARRGLVHLEGA